MLLNRALKKTYMWRFLLAVAGSLWEVEIEVVANNGGQTVTHYANSEWSDISWNKYKIINKSYTSLVFIYVEEYYFLLASTCRTT